MGVALTVCEKAVQAHYERAARAKERNAEWTTRVGRELRAGAHGARGRAAERAMDRRGGALGFADIAVACAWGFAQTTLADLVETHRSAPLTALSDFCERAEELPAFRAAPPMHGVVAPVG